MNEVFDMTRVHFYDPHPGLAGALARIPEAVKSIADAVDGTDGPIGPFLEKVRAVCPEGVVAAHGDFVSLRVGPVTGPGHSWRVIRFRRIDVPDELLATTGATS